MALPLPSIPARMAAVLLTGHGGYEHLRFDASVPVPRPATGEVLIRIAAAGINNTDINTRIGWYAPSVTASTAGAEAPAESGDWTGGGLSFPRIQGADVCGHVVAVGDGVDADRVGQRVIVQSCLRSLRQGLVTPWLGSEWDGGYAQYVSAPAADTYAIQCGLSDAELAAVPCAFGTAENLISRTALARGETVLITGASGNVGYAAIQLARRRGARVIALAAASKAAALTEAGADRCLDRDADLPTILGRDSVDVVIDVVGGPHWDALLDVLRPRGRYAVSGAIAGPIVRLDLRRLYLKDLTLMGCTEQDDHVFSDIVRYLERGEIRPLVAATYPLDRVVEAQEAFASKRHVGKIILLPPRADDAIV